MVAATSNTLAATNTKVGVAHAVCSEMKHEIRVLQVFSVLSVGGAETWLMSLLKYFREVEKELPVRLKIDVLLTGGEKAVFDDEAMALGARLFYVPFTRRNMLHFIQKFRRILASGNYDVIHDHQDYIAGLHFLMGLGHLPPVRIAHIHNPLYHRTYYANGPGRQIAQATGKRLLSKLATHVLGTSKQIVNEYGFVGRSFRRVTTGAAHCGFDVARFQGDRKRTHQEVCREFGWDNRAKIILFVGRLEADEVFHLGRPMSHKNPAYALEIAMECIARDERLRLLMVGAGHTKRREFENEVRGWGMEKEIRFVGMRQDVPRLMLGSDLLLFPSLAEGLGMVVVEAQAAGLRVLASDTIPRECVVVPGMVDFLPLQDPECWADEACRLMNMNPPDVDQCNRLLKESTFSIENSAAKLVSIYGSLA